MTQTPPPGGVVAGDCCEVMRAMPPLSVDAIITDPPFVMPSQHYASRAEDWSRKWADTSIFRGWWANVCDEMRRVLKPEGSVAVFTNHEAYSVFYPPMFERWPMMGCLVWDKGRPGMGRTWRKSHELIIVGRATGGWEPASDGTARSDILRCSPTPVGDRVHPVQKPVPLLRALVEAMVPLGGTVLDPFAGSGTTVAAALACGRVGMGVDLDPDYAAAAHRHIRNFVEADGQMALDGDAA